MEIESSQYELSQQTEDTGDDDRIRAVHEEDAAGDVFGRDGAGGALGEIVGTDRAALSQAGNGRRPKELEQMLRIYFLQQWFNLADPAVEEALYDSATLRQFVGIDLGAEPVPDETTVCKFRHLLEEHNLGEEILGTVNLYLQAKGVRITTGTIVDATLIHAPSSTKNREQSRDPEMHQTRKGKNWYFGMKAHVGVDSKTKIIHTAVATAANVSDVAMLPDLLHGEETRVWGDGAYQGQTRVMRECAPGRGISPSGAVATRAGSWMKWRGRKTGRSRKCGRGWSTCFR